MRGEREILARVTHGRPAQRSRILCYHGVGTPSWGVNDLSPTRLAEQLELALGLGYRFVGLDDAIQAGTPRSLAITFDDGLKSVATNAAPILRALGVPFTVFVVSEWAEGRHSFGDGVMMGWGELQRLVEAGASIGSHSASHPNFSRISRAEMARQLKDSKETIAARLGVTPVAFAIPFGRSSDWTADAADAAAAAGYTGPGPVGGRATSGHDPADVRGAVGQS